MTIVLNDLWRIDLATFQWTKLEVVLPVGVFFHSASITPDGWIYIFGGNCDGQAKVRTNIVQRFSIYST